MGNFLASHCTAQAGKKIWEKNTWGTSEKRTVNSDLMHIWVVYVTSNTFSSGVFSTNANHRFYKVISWVYSDFLSFTHISSVYCQFTQNLYNYFCPKLAASTHIPTEGKVFQSSWWASRCNSHLCHYRHCWTLSSWSTISVEASKNNVVPTVLSNPILSYIHHFPSSGHFHPRQPQARSLFISLRHYEAEAGKTNGTFGQDKNLLQVPDPAGGVVDLHGEERGLLCLGEAEAGGVGLGGQMGGIKGIGLLTRQWIFLVLMINCCPPVSDGENNSAASKCL